MSETDTSTKSTTSAAESNRYRTLLVAIAIPAIVLLLALPLLWNVNQQKASATNTDISEALLASLETADLASAASNSGYAATGDDVCITLMLATSTDSALSSVGLIVLNNTQHFSKLITLDVDTRASNGVSLAELYKTDDATGVVGEISHAGFVVINHITLMSTDGYTKLTDVISQGSANVSLDATSMLSDIEDTDMDLDTLKSVVTQAFSFGFDANSIVPASSLENVGTLAGTIS